MTNSLFTDHRHFHKKYKEIKCNGLFSLDHKLKLSLWIINELNFKISYGNSLNTEVDRLIFLNLISTLSLKPYTKVLQNWFSFKCQLCQVQTVKRMQRDDLDERKPSLTTKEPSQCQWFIIVKAVAWNSILTVFQLILLRPALLPAPAQKNARSEKTWTNNSGTLCVEGVLTYHTEPNVLEDIKRHFKSI